MGILKAANCSLKSIKESTQSVLVLETRIARYFPSGKSIPPLEFLTISPNNSAGALRADE
ncbi:hypothetical protein CDAR_451271, partial [Caerostris darwini]